MFGLRRPGDDRIGIFVSDESLPTKTVGALTGPANTFYFDFTTLIDRDPMTSDDPLADYVFFFRGASNGDGTYQSLPDGVVKFQATYTDEASAERRDEGGDRTDTSTSSDGGSRTNTSDPMDGQRRADPNFEANITIDEPVLGSFILEQLQGGGLEATQFPIQIWVPDPTPAITEFNLVAYRLPPQSDGNIDATTGVRPVQNIFIENFEGDLEGLPPILQFEGVQQLFRDSTDNQDDCGWVRGDLIQTGYNSGQFSFNLGLAPLAGNNDGASQRAAFAEAIEQSFAPNVNIPLRSISRVQDGDDWVITVETGENIPVELNIAVGNAAAVAVGADPITVADPFNTPDDRFVNPGADSAGITIRQTRQGIRPYNYTDSDFVPPRLRIIHEDPEIRFFDRNSGLISLVSSMTVASRVVAEPTSTIVTPTEWTQVVIALLNFNQGSNGNDDQWSGAARDSSNYDFSTIDVIYDEVTLGSTGVEVPDQNPVTGLFDYVDFPAEREGSQFTLQFCIGSGVATDVASTTNEAPTKPVSSIFQDGAYDLANTPSYVALRVSDSSVPAGPLGQPEGEVVFLFSITPGADINQAIQELQLQIDRRAPRLRALVSGTGRLSIQPANYNDLANFVLEFAINNSTEINRVRELLDPNRFTQDEFNPKPAGNLPERVQVGRNENNEEIDNIRGFIEVSDGSLALDSSQDPTFEFDVLRPWPRTQINFTLEYPIFAATRPFPDGVTTNKIIGSDIGYSRPAFMRPEVARIETPETASLIRVSSTGQDAPEDYESFIERVQQGLAPEFTTEMLASVALWTDGSTCLLYTSPSPRDS